MVLPAALRNLRRKHLPDVPSFSPHDLRRSAATGMARIGFSDELIGCVLNHAPQGITGQVYQRHKRLNEMRQALDAWGLHIQRLVECP